MLLQRIFGLHGRGKSETLFSMLEECVREKKQVFLVVPEQTAVNVERLLIDRLGNPANMYIEVINFKRLCNRVFRETGGLSARVPDAAGELLAMSHVLCEVRDTLKEYASLAEDTDFAEKMLATIAEMHRARLSPEDLDVLCDELRADGAVVLADKLHDVSLAYTAFTAYTQNVLEFPGDLLDKLYETLCETPFFAGKQVFFDDFYGFTAQELAIMGKILATADRTVVTLVCESEKQTDPMFSRGVNAAVALKRLADKSGVPIRDLYLSENRKHVPGSALCTVADRFSFTAFAKTAEVPQTENITLYRCENIYTEAACAVKIVTDLMLSGAKPREIAITARDTASYEGILDEKFLAAGIPFSHDTHTDLANTPLAALVSAAFEIYFSWSLTAVLSFIKTGLSGICDREADLLELYIRTWNIHGKAYMHEEWYMNPDGMRETGTDGEKLGLIRSAKDKIFLPLDAFCEELDAAKTVHDIANAVYHLVTGVLPTVETENGERVLCDGADGEYLDLLYRALDSIDATLGREQISPRRFAVLYSAVLDKMRVGKIPERIDQVRFSPVTLMRTDGVKYMILLGANDGVFPCAAESGDIFREREREKLAECGVRFADSASDKAYDELFLAYTALCSGSMGAYVLYRAESVMGEEMYPSLIVTLLKKLTAVTEKEFRVSSLANVSSDAALFENLSSLTDKAEKAAAIAYLKEDPLYAKKLAAAEKVDESVLPLSERTLAALYGDTMNSSYSRLEKFHNCPFSYFCTYTLRLSPPAVGKLGAAEYGNIVHKALEELAPVICERVRTAGSEGLCEKELCAMVKEKVLSIKKTLMPEGSMAVTQRLSHMFDRIEKALVPLCKSLVGELAVSKFTPVDFELDIAPGGSVEPVCVSAPGGKTLRIIGKIDRVDTYYDEKTGKTWVRITDYKTGSTSFRLSDVLDGFNLQMLLYLYTLVKNGSTRYGDLYPAGVLYSKAVMPSVDMSLNDAGGVDFTEPEYASETSGIVANDFDLIFAMDETGSGNYVPVRLTGGVLAEDAKNTLTPDALQSLLEDSVAFAYEFASGIAAGKKNADPKAAYGKDACEYCDMKSICPGGGEAPFQLSRAGLHKDGM